MRACTHKAITWDTLPQGLTLADRPYVWVLRLRHLARGGVAQGDVAEDAARDRVKALLLPHERGAGHRVVARHAHRRLGRMPAQQVLPRQACGTGIETRQPDLHVLVAEPWSGMGAGAACDACLPSRSCTCGNGVIHDYESST